ncbi:MAG TPA: regulatory iron-sulfur-containing complex subunit RicT, partial [Symbiobacteriaceae bacterium]|nr:regulatory iron-sulfur-containing complex subunit RicT [Symbiobacteriaceae bacterium]
MIRVVGVRFKKAGKVYYFDPADFPIAAGQKVVVETARGVEYGEVAVGPKDVPDEQVVQPLKKVLRIGNEKDAVVAAENKRKENEAFGVAQKKIEGHSLDMNLVDVEYTFDGSKIIFYFTAEGRIDFRELVRDLAGVFRTRIEMRQIGVRDEAKLLGGIGPCGRILCCTSFLGDFAPVSIRMAKDQNLSLNPSKISGLCGRLMCCLRYEQETYEAAKKDPTLAPGYVPPVLIEDTVPALDDLEDRPAPIIGVRGGRESGMSARIAQAVGVTERPRREERPTERRAPRPQAEGQQAPQGERRREPQPPRQQSQAPRPQAEGQQAPQGERRREPQPPRQQG